MPKSQQPWVRYSIRRHSLIWVAADEAVLNSVDKTIVTETAGEYILEFSKNFSEVGGFR
jgi:hypothetical protein